MRETDAVDQGVQHGLNVQICSSVLLYRRLGEEQFPKPVRAIDYADVIMFSYIIASRYSEIRAGHRSKKCFYNLLTPIKSVKR